MAGPASRMKMPEEHVVPFAQQAIAILRDLEPITCGGRYDPCARKHTHQVFLFERAYGVSFILCLV